MDYARTEAPSGVAPPALFGGTSIDTALGHARFADVSVGGAARRVRLRASSEGLIDAVSEPFDVVAQSGQSHWQSAERPSDILQRDAVLHTPDLTVEVVDALDHVVSDAPTTSFICASVPLATWRRALARQASWHRQRLLLAIRAVWSPLVITRLDRSESVGARWADLFLEAHAEASFWPNPAKHSRATARRHLELSGLLNQHEHMEASVDVAWLEGQSFDTQPSVSVLDSVGSIVSTMKGIVTLSGDASSITTTRPTRPRSMRHHLLHRSCLRSILQI